MLSTPHAGWTLVTVCNTDIGSASYLDDVPNMLLDVFIQYFDAVKNDRYTGFSVTFDAEGYSFGLFLFNDSLYAVKNTSDTYPYLHIQEIEPEINMPTSCLMASLAEELIQDIQTDIELWCHWNPAEEDDTKNELLAKVNTLHGLLENKPAGCI